MLRCITEDYIAILSHNFPFFCRFFFSAFNLELAFFSSRFSFHFLFPSIQTPGTARDLTQCIHPLQTHTHSHAHCLPSAYCIFRFMAAAAAAIAVVVACIFFRFSILLNSVGFLVCVCIVQLSSRNFDSLGTFEMVKRECCKQFMCIQTAQNRPPPK